MVSRRLGVLVVALALGVVASAGVAFAGGNADTDFSKLKPIKPPKSCDDVTGVSDSEIKVGVLVPSSGPLSTSFAAMKDGIQARVDVANEKGETGSRKITLVEKDDASDPARNLTAAQELVEQDQVFGIIEDSPNAFSSAKYLNENDVPVVGWHLGLAEFGEYPNMFGWRNSTTTDQKGTYTTRNVDVLKELGAKKIALVGTNVGNSATFIDQVADSIKLVKNSGLKVVYKNTDIPPERREFGDIVQQIKDSGADGMYTGMDLQANAALSEQLAQAGVNMKAVIFPGGYDTRVLGLPGVEGSYFGVEFIPFEENPAAFTEYKAQMDKEDKFATGQVPYIGWLSADAFIRGIVAAGVKCPTQKAFINNLRLVDDYDGGGAFTPVDFRKIFGRPFYCVYYVHVENGAFVPQFDGKPFCANGLVSDGKVTKLTDAQKAEG
jgi:branched-chain amino acid transport system substrate-binding protein